MIRTLLAALAILSLILPQAATSYGRYAHGEITRIAMRNIAPATRTKVLAMLRRSALLETPTCAANTPVAASTWPDCIRSMGLRFEYTSPWHYQNVDICAPFDLASACANGNCVSAQVTRNLKLLQDRAIPLREKVAALAFLIHFTQDLHMPLHAGDRSDRGGNDVKSTYGLYTSDWLNLHSIWDGALAERAMTTPPVPNRIYSATERAALAAGSVEDWSRQAWQVSRDVAYTGALDGEPCGPKPTGRITLSNETIAAAVPAAKLQTERAAIRLARLLDEAFDTANSFDSREERRR